MLKDRCGRQQTHDEPPFIRQSIKASGMDQYSCFPQQTYRESGIIFHRGNTQDGYPSSLDRQARYLRSSLE